MIFRALVLVLSCWSVASTFLLGGSSSTSQTRRLDEGTSWLGGYNVFYEKCFRSESVASFRLCPAKGRCHEGCKHGGEYLMGFHNFLSIFTKSQLAKRQYHCQLARENCEYQNDDACYKAMGMDYCIYENNEAHGFHVQGFLECQAIDHLDDNGNQHYVGPYCADDGYNIYLGVFSDEKCTSHVDVSEFEAIMGYALPHSHKSIIDKGCASCNEAVQSGGADAEQGYGVTWECEDLHALASDRCEDHLDHSHDSSGCTHIRKLKRHEKHGSAFRWVMGFLLVGAAVAGAFFVYEKKKEQEQRNKTLQLEEAEQTSYDVAPLPPSNNPSPKWLLTKSRSEEDATVATPPSRAPTPTPPHRLASPTNEPINSEADRAFSNKPPPRRGFFARFRRDRD